MRAPEDHLLTKIPCTFPADQRFDFPRVLTAGEKVPYGVAIAIGAILIAVQGRYGFFAL